MIVDVNESRLSQNFSSYLIAKIDFIISQNRSVNVVSSPGVGSSLFFKYLQTHRDYQFIYVDADHFADATVEEFYRHFLKALGSGKLFVDRKEFLVEVDLGLKPFLEDPRPIVFIFAHVDLMKKHFSKDFFDILKYIRSKQSNRFSYILQSSIPLVELLQQKLLLINTNLIGQPLYLSPYNDSDLEEIARVLLYLDTSNAWIKKALVLSGGSYYLLSLLSRTERFEQPLLDPFIKIYFKRLVDGLSPKLRKIVEMLGRGKQPLDVDEYLLGIGIVKKDDAGYRLFTPLFADYLKQNIQLKLSAGEMRLFQYLKQKMGRVVLKDELFLHVWGEDVIGSDWALNSMIYRIRQNPAFKDLGYEIESYKKVGYRLVRN